MVHFNATVEDSALNQYWYSPSTIDALIEEVEMHATHCAFLSSPSLYFAAPSKLRLNSKVFEFDKQWKDDPGFVFYDYHHPDRIPVQLFEAFDYVVVDPPFITADVWKMYMETVKLLLKPHGKVLFTSVLENHTMLEGLLDGPLFVPLFRPSIPHLTYQYHCFLSYPATCLQRENTELPKEDPKTLAALRMANDLRESEQAFTAQMQARDREGETPLPALLHEAQGGASRGNVLKWGYIPEGWSMYANGAEAPPVEAAPVDYGTTYALVESMRNKLETFKKGIDQSQKHLDVLLRHQGDDPKLKAVVASTEVKHQALLKEMELIAQWFEQGIVVDSGFAEASEALKESIRRSNEVLVSVMRECVAAYLHVPIVKQNLQELAADATRKYKSPLFSRQKELLAELKALKKSFAEAQKVKENP